MKSSANVFLLSLLTQMISVTSFAPYSNTIRPFSPTHSSSPNSQSKSQSKSTTSTQMMMMDDPQSYLSSIHTASTYLSTVSADIDSIPQNEFATVFAGGIAVMIGGVLSTVMVGFLLESGNSYANVVADSYAQGGDEEFWESLSPEDQVKTKELLEKIRKSKEAKEGGGGAAAAAVGQGATTNDLTTVGAAASLSEVKASPVSNTSEKKEEISMFSDYDD